MTLRRTLWGLGSLLFALPVIATWHSADISLVLKFLSAAVLTATALRPAWGLLMVAGLLPLGTYIGAAASLAEPAITGASVGELTIAPFLLAAGLRVAFGSQASPSRLARPATVLAVVIAVGAVLGLSLEQYATDFPADYLAGLWRSVSDTYVIDRLAYVPLHGAAIWIEGLLLAVMAERLVRADLRMQASLPRMLLAGATGSAMCVCYRLAEISLRTSAPVSSALMYLRIQRFNPLYSDLNAAGSFYALFLVPVVWLALAGKRRWNWLIAVPLFVASWLAGSRTAWAAALIGLALLWVSTRRMSRLLVAGSAALAAVLLATVVLWNPGGTARASAGLATDVRVRLVKVGLHMAAAHPFFGVGLGQFRPASKAYVTPGLIALFPPAAAGENAHNNFIQVLAELGLIGFTAFIWLLGVGAISIAGAIRAREPIATPAAGFAGGMVAFLVTCLAGHPLLTAEVLWLFLLVLGLTTGLLPWAPAAPGWSKWLAAGLVVWAVGSAPVRWSQLRRSVDLDHVVIGGTRVVGIEDGVSYHLADARSTWFVRANSRAIEVSLRVTPDSRPPCLVHVDVDGRHANDVETVTTMWTRLVFPFTPGPNDPVSRRIDLRVDGVACHLMVGTIKLRD